MINENIIPGPNYSFDKKGIAAMSRTLSGFVIHYKAGAIIKIDIEDPTDREGQYYLARAIWRGEINWEDVAKLKTYERSYENTL